MSTMNTQAWLAAAGLAAVLYLLATSLPVALRLRALRHEIHADRIRNRWAEARVMMYRLARDGKLPVESATFVQFVRVQTFILRRPDEYKEISRLLFDELLRRDHGAEPEWRREVPTWPREMKEVLREMLGGTYELLRSRRRGRVMLFLARKVLRAAHLGKSAETVLHDCIRRIDSLSADRRLFAAAARLESIHVT